MEGLTNSGLGLSASKGHLGTVLSDPGGRFLSGAPVQVLIIDDEPTEIEWVCDALAQSGVSAHGVLTGGEGVAWVSSHRPNLVLVDQTLPDMTGTEVLKAIRSLGAPIRVVSFSAGVTSESKSRALGFDGWIAKPAPLSALLKVVGI